ncbi:MAG: regulatory iron-sulfur-containing complex subunit RicT [Phycisphaerae bacterium]
MARPPVPGAKVVVRTERGVELGEVVVSVSNDPSWRCIASGRLRDYLRACGPDYPFHRGGKVLRQANAQDVIDFRHLMTSAREEGAFARQKIRELNLPMRLVTVEHLLGGERIIFYFSAESRVDFRELVRTLASQFRTRIEMRQVGARDEARLVADYERCGQRCCCQEYLKDLKPVSMRMAKTQKATLDPSKISGRCGRLMCCLRYEDAVYEDLRKKLPRRNTWVRTEKLVGKVVDSQIITQLVQLLLPDNTLAVVANEEILERDVPPAAVQPPPEPREPSPERSERRLLREEATAGPRDGARFRGEEKVQEPPAMPRRPLPSPAKAAAPLGGVRPGRPAEPEGQANEAPAPTAQAASPASSPSEDMASVGLDITEEEQFTPSGDEALEPVEVPDDLDTGAEFEEEIPVDEGEAGGSQATPQQRPDQRPQPGQRPQGGQNGHGSRGRGYRQGQRPQQGQGNQQGQRDQQGRGDRHRGRHRRRRHRRHHGGGGGPQGQSQDRGQPGGNRPPGPPAGA